MKRGLIIILAMAMAVGIGAAVVHTQNQEVSQLPGITVEDPKPAGCVDCHKPRPDIGQDFRLSVELQGIEGHPDISGMVATQEIPGLCMTCHTEQFKPLSNIVHKKHFEFEKDPLENHFIASYQGQCLYCHKLELETGEMTVKSGLEEQP
ncbi:MAG: hypothetical protein ACE5LQ_05700 [Candidatus Bipolaricaulia bacterium]